MELKNFFAQDDQGNKLPGATCYLYQRGTESLVTGLVNVNGMLLGNPFTADQQGLIQLAAANGLYDLRVVHNLRDFRIRLQFNDVAGTVEAAEAAAGRAEVAADTSAASANQYPTVEEGIAATAGTGSTNRFFTVPVTGNNAVLWYRNDAGVAVQINGAPSTQAVSQSMLTSGEKIASDDFLPVGQVFNGATYITSNGKVMGFSIPAGFVGNTSYVSYLVQPAADLLARLAGSVVRLKVVCDATEGFFPDKVSGTVVAQVYRAGAAVNVGTLVRSEQIGTKLYREVLYTVTAADQKFGVCLQVQGFSGNNAHSVSVASVSYSVETWAGKDVSAGDLLLAARLKPVSDAVSAAESKVSGALLTSGNVYGTASSSVGAGQALNGATRINEGAVNKGFTIPAGQGGGSSYITAWVTAGGLSGKVATLTTKYEATANFLANTPNTNVSLSVRRTTGISNVAPMSRTLSQSGTEVTQVIQYLVDPLDIDIGPVFQASGGLSAQGDSRYIKVTSVSFTLPAPVGSSQNDAMFEAKLAPKLDAISNATGVYTLQTVLAGIGQALAAPAAANATLAGATGKAKRAQILLEPGYYPADSNWYLAEYTTLKAKRHDRPHIHFELPDGSPLLPANYQPFWMDRSGTLDGIKITARNARYALHCEASGANPDSTIRFKDIWMEHLGNSPTVPAWVSQAALGCGVSSGWDLRSEGSTYRSPFACFSYHTNNDFAKPSYVENNGDRLIGTAADGAISGYSLRIQPLGSRQRDQYRAYGCQFMGDIWYQPDPWKQTTLDYQPAAHTEVEMVGWGNSPAVFIMTEFGRALKIASNTEAGSTVTVAGDAVPLLFGEVKTFPGVVALPAYVHGTFDISGAGVGLNRNIFITALGKRLGNCTSVNKTLTITLNGDAPVSIVFNQDYTNVTNATILATINAELGSSGVASEYNLGGRYRPLWTDEEKTLWNASATEGIPMGAALVHDGSYKKIRKMTSSDPSGLFIGIAWEDIYPGTWGRVKTCGYLPTSDLLGYITPLTFGQPVYINPAMAGRMTANVGTYPIMSAIRSDAVEVAKK